MMGACVFVVDDDASVRKSLESQLHDAGWQARSCASLREYLALPRSLEPCCLVLDVALTDLGGLDLHQLVCDRAEVPIIFTGHGDAATIVRAMKAGAVEFLTKPFTMDSLLEPVREALERSEATLAQEAEKLALRNRYASLSPREREVMSLVVSGRLNKQVGGELGISEYTVKAHRGKLMKKMGAASLPELVNMAARLHLSLPRLFQLRSVTLPPRHTLGDAAWD
jgi:FixJ family two-component response regulator